MHYVDLVAVLAVMQFIAFIVLTGRARAGAGLRAPAVTGHEGFERMYRVQMNTLELLIAFLPALFLAAKYWAPWLVASIGAVFLVGRLIYWRAYVREPAKRGIGFVLSMLPTLILAAMALVGVMLSWVGLRAA
jgi:glutathione S-transferase